MSESEENSTVTVTHKINRAILISYIKVLANDQAQQSFINPNMCIKIINFVYILKNRTGDPREVSHKNMILFLLISFSGQKNVSSKFGVYRFLVFREILAHSSNPHISDYGNRNF